MSIFEEVLTVFSQADTLTTSLQDWRKGRRAEIQEVNGWVIDTLKAHGLTAPVNARVVELAYAIEANRLEARPENAALLIETYEATRRQGQSV